MTNTDAPRFAAAMARLAVAFTDVKSSAARTDVYFAALADLSIEAVEHAAARAIRERTFFPRPAELRALAGDQVPSVGLVESLLVAHLRETGGERRHPTDAFLCLVVDRLGGIRSVAGMDSEQRLALLAKLLPGLVEACRVRGLPMPTEGTTALPAIVQRSLGGSRPVPQITGEAETARTPAGIAAFRDLLPGKLKRGVRAAG